MTNEQNIIKALAPYVSMFPDCRLDDRGLLMYAKAMSDIPAEAVNAAMLVLIRRAKFFPRVADIVDAVKSLTEVSSDSGKLTAGEAWEEVMANVKNTGVYGEWKFSTPEVERAARQFGISELCMLEMRDVNTARAQFRDIYNLAVKADGQKQELKRVLGRVGQRDLAQIAEYAAAIASFKSVKELKAEGIET